MYSLMIAHCQQYMHVGVPGACIHVVCDARVPLADANTYTSIIVALCHSIQEIGWELTP